MTYNVCSVTLNRTMPCHVDAVAYCGWL